MVARLFAAAVVLDFDDNGGELRGNFSGDVDTVFGSNSPVRC